jgi:dihydropteroate synthase
MIDEGADIIDIGGESTRPGAAPTPERSELGRVLPLIERVAALGIPVSADTRKSAVMRAALAAGASMINDVSALRGPGALEAIADSAQPVAICLMHMRGEPETMQQDVAYADVGAEVKAFLAERAAACEAAGIARERIVVDPGFGFGKMVDHNLDLLRRLPELSALGYPVLVGLSRKSTIGALTGRAVAERTAGNIAAALAAVARGAKIVRAHEVRETVDALKVWSAVNEHSP